MEALPADVRNSLMARLREETRAQHETAESRPLEQSLFRGVAPKALYVQVLEQRFLIHQALERGLRALSEARPGLAGVVRHELFGEPHLRRDLENFGVHPESVTPVAATLDLLRLIDRLSAESSVALLGIYYVFEGSKNGSRILAARLSKAYQLPPGPGLLYFDPHGERQRAIWQEFRQSMDALDLAPAEHDAIVSAAQRTFECVARIDDELYARQG